MTEQLKPCPCCGAPAIWTETSLPDSYSDHDIIACTSCGLMNDRNNAEEWNIRHTPAPVVDVTDEMVERALNVWCMRETMSPSVAAIRIRMRAALLAAIGGKS